MKISKEPIDQDDPQQGLELFLQLAEIWYKCIPPALRGEDPRLLSRFLEVCNSEKGVPQSGLRIALGLGQSKVSRLAAKAKKSGLMRDDIPRADGRLRLTKLTPEGEDVLYKLWRELKSERKNFMSKEEHRKMWDEVDASFERR